MELSPQGGGKPPNSPVVQFALTNKNSVALHALYGRERPRLSSQHALASVNARLSFGSLAAMNHQLEPSLPS